jgi:AraC-like DNA-binding protein
MLESVPAPRRPRFQEPTAAAARPEDRPPAVGELGAPLGVLLGAEQVAVSGDLGPIGRHHHAAPAVVIGVDGPLRFLAGADGDGASGAATSRQSRAALIAPGFRHAVDLAAGRIAVFVLPAAGAPLSDEPVHDLRPGPWLELAEAVAQGALESFEPVARALDQQRIHPRPIDARLRHALGRLALSLDDNLAIEDIAGDAGLSPTRLMALARAQLGTSLRGYRRWLRAFQVARGYATGASLTEAALEAGFASSAHLSAAVREQFGIRPSQLLTPRARAAMRTAR